ncbi:S1 family peptidase [Vibrio sp. Isolate22]|uniref:trypsin-like serine protease n=1 Tax=Vibrio sp. Isolate22 TaxID=2908532 RepID=UPI001EFCADF7|nr:trypsin-like serine protease [Vibrio sp. Isolate22]MCG9692855.1 S1 family peptidase [Vibrio sp. Isolate22]
MKKTLLALGLSALSSSCFAITNGTVVDWKHDFDDYVSGNCTGLIVGGDKILTAAHCGITNNVVVIYDGSYLAVKSKVDHPNYTGFRNYDVSILDIDKQATQNIHFFADLNQATASVGDAVHSYGFAGSLTELKRGDFTVSNVSDPSIDHLYHKYAIGGSETESGDSGSAWFNASNEVIGVTYGGQSIPDLFYSKDFILDTVDGWHYPTVIKGTGTQTIKVQSLHQNPVVDAAYVVGDVAITGGTCQTLPAIDAFDTCTYELDVSGSGQLHLTTNEVIDINPVAPTPVPPPTTTPSSGGSGGSLGFLSLLGLAALGRLRKRQV